MNINALPNEILINVLRYLDYWDLKLRIPLVCRRFRFVTGLKSKFGAIDKILFRDVTGPRKDNDELAAARATQFAVHPVFNLLTYTWSPENSYHSILFTANGREFYSSPVATENAISPASCKILLHFNINGHKINIDGSSSTREAIPVIGIMGTMVMLLMGEMNPPGADPDAQSRKKIGNIVGGFEWHGLEKVEIKDGYVHLYITHSTAET